MRRALPFLLLVVSCGGRVASLSEQTEGDTAAGPAPTATSGQTPPRPGSGPTKVPPPDLPPPPPTPSAVYTAHAWPGGLDHIEIFKADFGRDTCVHVHLASPGAADPGAPFGHIATPADWSVKSADRSKGASTCKPQQPRSPLPAADGKGSITWVAPSGTLFPCSLDVHMALIFKDTKGAEQLDADSVPVDNCK